MSRHTAPVNTVDEYIAQQPDGFRETLEELRAIIQSAAPDAEELISYQVPAFKYHYMLVGFGAAKKHVALYTMNPALIKQMEAELTGVKVSGTSLHFIPGQKLPATLIKKIVKARVKENKEKANAKTKK